MSIKPINMQPNEVQAILAGNKTQTRRIAKPIEFLKGKNPEWSGYRPVFEYGEFFLAGGDGEPATKPAAAPCQPGDILWVRETFGVDCDDCIHNEGEGWKGANCSMMCGAAETPHVYRANHGAFAAHWYPSIHMPKAAARLFLRVTGVRVERVQDGFNEPICPILTVQAEGIEIGDTCRECIDSYGSPCCVDAVDEDGSNLGECGLLDDARTRFADLWDDLYTDPQPVKRKGIITHYVSYPWQDTQETREHKGKPWHVYGNPWVYAYTFERCEKPEGWPE